MSMIENLLYVLHFITFIPYKFTDFLLLWFLIYKAVGNRLCKEPQGGKTPRQNTTMFFCHYIALFVIFLYWLVYTQSNRRPRSPVFRWYEKAVSNVVGLKPQKSDTYKNKNLPTIIEEDKPSLDASTDALNLPTFTGLRAHSKSLTLHENLHTSLGVTWGVSFSEFSLSKLLIPTNCSAAEPQYCLASDPKNLSGVWSRKVIGCPCHLFLRFACVAAGGLHS